MQQPAWQMETALTKLREARSQSVASAEQLALSTYRLLAAQEDTAETEADAVATERLQMMHEVALGLCESKAVGHDAENDLLLLGQMMFD